MKDRINILIIVLTCLLFTSSPYFSQTVNNLVFLIIENVLILVLLYKKIHKEIIKSNIPIIVFWIIMVATTFFNLGFSSRTLNAFVTGLRYVVIFISFYYTSGEIGFNKLICILFKIIFSITIIEDLFVLLTCGQGLSNDGMLAYFLIGNKFGVSYLHMFSLSLLLSYLIINKQWERKKTVFWIYNLFSVILCAVADCNTGVIGCLSFGFLVLLFGRSQKYISYMNKPLIFLLFLIFSTYLLVGTNFVIENDLISNILLKFSHTGKILTGRLEMYDIALDAIVKKPLLGYGINNTVVQDTLSWGNPQNGLLKMLLDHGIVGTLSFFYVCWSSLKIKRHLSSGKYQFALTTFIYAMAICSLVEINFSGYFFAGLALINTLNYERCILITNDKKKKETR